jgi:hypothetical protein
MQEGPAVGAQWWAGELIGSQYLAKVLYRKARMKAKKEKKKEKRRVVLRMGAIMAQPQREMVRTMLLLLMLMVVEVSILDGGCIESGGGGIGVAGVVLGEGWMKRAKGIRGCLRLLLLLLQSERCC